MTQKTTYDLIVVGSGTAGMTAALYAARRALKVLVLAKNIGGQMNLAVEIENYPGFEKISGFELAQKMKQQAERAGAVFVADEIIRLTKRDDIFELGGAENKYASRAVVLAFGLTPRNLNVPGERELTGRGVSYCATCDGPLYKNKIVGVVGGGNSAMEATEYLARLAKKVYLIHRSDVFQAEKSLVEQIKATANVVCECFMAVKEIKGDKKIKSVILATVDQPNQVKELSLDGLFVEIGYEAKTGWLKDAVVLNDRGEIKINRHNEASVPGVFAAGDCADTHYKQVVISAGEGAKAALSAYKYLAATTGKIVAPDWGKK